MLRKTVYPARVYEVKKEGDRPAEVLQALEGPKEGQLAFYVSGVPEVHCVRRDQFAVFAVRYNELLPRVG